MMRRREKKQHQTYVNAIDKWMVFVIFESHYPGKSLTGPVGRNSEQRFDNIIYLQWILHLANKLNCNHNHSHPHIRTRARARACTFTIHSILIFTVQMLKTFLECVRCRIQFIVYVYFDCRTRFLVLQHKHKRHEMVLSHSKHFAAGHIRVVFMPFYFLLVAAAAVVVAPHCTRYRCCIWIWCAQFRSQTLTKMCWWWLCR